MQIVQEKSEKSPCQLKSKLKGLCFLVLNLVQSDLVFSLCFCRSGRNQVKNPSTSHLASPDDFNTEICRISALDL